MSTDDRFYASIHANAFAVSTDSDELDQHPDADNDQPDTAPAEKQRDEQLSHTCAGSSGIKVVDSQTAQEKPQQDGVLSSMADRLLFGHCTIAIIIQVSSVRHEDKKFFGRIILDF